MAETILFACFALAAVVGAVWVILGKNATWSALGLLVNMAALGALYILLNAPFVGIVQFIIYAGAIVVVFLFVVMLLSVRRGEGPEHRYFERYAGMGLAILVFAALVFFGVRSVMPSAPASPADNLTALATTLFSSYLLPLEMAGVLLLTGMLAVVMLAKPHPEQDE
jgi:NADH-quinone oxidoreductase subunit J